jgi:hypothetical protein
MQAGIFELCDTIEACYEFMLGYAAKGLPVEEATGAGSQIREFLARAASAIKALGESCAALIKEENLEPIGRYQAFLSVLDRDAQNALAAIELVLAQPSITSQLIDNLNASIHLRALLTDLFLIGDVLRSVLQAKPNGVISENQA